MSGDDAQFGQRQDLSSRILKALDARPATLGNSRLLCIDGPSGSGKTTLASRLAMLSEAPLVSLDAIYRGWSGLDTLPDMLMPLLQALDSGRDHTFRAWDWHRDEPGETVRVSPAPRIIVEGVGAGHLHAAAFCTLLVWIEHPQAAERALARDGEASIERLSQWRVRESAYFAAHRPRARADITLGWPHQRSSLNLHM